MTDSKNGIDEPTDLTLTLEDRRSTTSSGGSGSTYTESQSVTKKKLHNRSRWNRLTAMSIGVLTLAIVGVAVFVVLRSLGIRLRQPSGSVVLERMAAADIALHASPDDCWMSIHGVVYDLTEYAPRHPTGPDYIWDRCGMDGTVDYDRFHNSIKLLDVVAPDRVGLFGTASTAFQTSDESGDSGDSGDTTAPEYSATFVEPIAVTDPAPGECWNAQQVALHSVEEDCYYILYGAIFDFTDYIQDHPGGPEVMVAECGTDATAAYETAKKHDIDLLEKEGAYDYLVGTPCANAPVVTTNEVLPASTLVGTDGVAISDPLPGACWELEQVAQHKTVEDCYYILYGNVFDFTDYIDQHPGGDEVMITECGTDATAVYETAKKHDIDLLEKKGGNDYLLGTQCVAASTVVTAQAVDHGPVLPDPLPGACWSLDHVAQHNTVDDCYYILYGSVFDFTDYIESHPGGDEVMISECGTDATAVYETAKKHDIALLEKKGGYDYLIAQACAL